MRPVCSKSCMMAASKAASCNSRSKHRGTKPPQCRITCSVCSSVHTVFRVCVLHVHVCMFLCINWSTNWTTNQGTMLPQCRVTCSHREVHLLCVCTCTHQSMSINPLNLRHHAIAVQGHMQSQGSVIQPPVFVLVYL